MAGKHRRSTHGDRRPGRNSAASPRRGGELDWLVWQLVDSAFPTGGFAHSAGLEAAWQHGEVRNRAQLAGFIESSLHQLGRAALPYVNEAHRRPRQWKQLDHHCDAFTSNHVANRASRLQGKALLNAVERIFRTNPAPPDHVHFAPAFGALLRSLHVPLETTQRQFVFTHLRSILAAAVRLNIVGPMEAQLIQRDFSKLAESVRDRCKALVLKDLAQTAPRLDLWQGTQDRLYSRLFQS